MCRTRLSAGGLLILLSCACAAGGGAAGEALFVPASPLTVDTWTNSSAPWFTYPEASPSSNYYLQSLAARPNLGVAISGGGYRAATTALGYIRALHHLGVLPKVRYLSSNSGGSWFSSAFSYQDSIPLAEFLGPYVPPQNLTLASLKSVAGGKHGHFASVIAAATIRLKAAQGGLWNAFAGESNVSRTGGWTTAVGLAFLAPYNLSAEHSTFSANGTKGPIHQAAAGLGIPIYFYQGAEDRQAVHKQPRPFPIIIASLRSNLSHAATFYPVEFTPQYVGVPTAATYSVQLNSPGVQEVIGGGFVEPVGFNSKPLQVPTLPLALQAGPGQPPSNLADPLASTTNITTGARHRRLLQQPNPLPGLVTGAVSAGQGAASHAATAAAAAATQAAAAVGAADRNAALPIKVAVQSAGVVPLKAVAGISSGAFAQALGMLPGQARMALKAFVGTERLELWNQIDFQAFKIDFTDGAGTDNYAVTPLLRRKVGVIIACIANSEELTRRRTPKDLASSLLEVSAFFGAVPKTSLAHTLTGFDADMYNKMQVFAREGWDRLLEGLLNTTEGGGPVHHLDEYAVMDNPTMGVHGGWKVKVLWVLNAKQSTWEQQLPAEVSQLLAATRKEAPAGTANVTAAAVRAAGLEDFPYIPTSNADYTSELTGMLSQQATWQMTQLKPLIDKLLQDSGRFKI